MDCDCEIDTELFVHSLGGVISEAALELYTTKCRGTPLLHTVQLLVKTVYAVVPA